MWDSLVMCVWNTKGLPVPLSEQSGCCSDPEMIEILFLLCVCECVWMACEWRVTPDVTQSWWKEAPLWTTLTLKQSGNHKEKHHLLRHVHVCISGNDTVCLHLKPVIIWWFQNMKCSSFLLHIFKHQTWYIFLCGSPRTLRPLTSSLNRLPRITAHSPQTGRLLPALLLQWAVCCPSTRTR